jgi:hypothetical protein
MESFFLLPVKLLFEEKSAKVHAHFRGSLHGYAVHARLSLWV